MTIGLLRAITVLTVLPLLGMADASPGPVLLHRAVPPARATSEMTRLDPSAIQSFTERLMAFARTLSPRQQTLLMRLVSAAENVPASARQHNVVDTTITTHPDSAVMHVAAGTSIGHEDPRPRPPGGDVAIGPKQDDPRHPSIPQDNEKPAVPGAPIIIAPGEHGGVRPHDPHAYDPTSPTSDVHGAPSKAVQDFVTRLREFGLSLPERDRTLLSLLLQNATSAPPPPVRPEGIPGGLPAMQAAVARGLGP